MLRPLRSLVLIAGLACGSGARAQAGPDDAGDEGAAPVPEDAAPAAPLPQGTTDEAHAPPPEPVPLPPATPGSRLETAVRAYQAGSHDLAMSQLIALLREAPEEPGVLLEARLYMGEIFFVQGNEAGAREAFELVLQSDPDHLLDPFKHPPDVCAFFELVRESGTWKPRQPPSSGPVPPLVERNRPSPWLPLGIAQVRQERVVPGVLLGIGQGLTCGLSLGLGTWLYFDRRYGSTNEPGFDEETGARLWTYETLQSRRNAQLAMTGACYGTYTLGVVDAFAAERRHQRRSQAQLGQGPLLAVTVGRRF